MLGALGHEDRIAYDRHLRTCPRCSAAVAELAALPGLLARLPGVPEPVPAPQPPPDTVLPGILAAVRRRRSRHRVRGAAAGVAAAAVPVIGTLAVTDPAQPAPAATGPTVTLTRVTDAPVDTELRPQGVAWGTRIPLTCRYHGPAAPSPMPPRRRTSWSWCPPPTRARGASPRGRCCPARTPPWPGSNDLRPGQIAEVQLRDATGHGAAGGFAVPLSTAPAHGRPGRAG